VVGTNWVVNSMITSWLD